MSFTVPIDCQCLAVGVAAVLILLSGLIDLKIIIKSPAGQLCYAISCFYACPTLFCITVSRKKWEKIVACHRHKSKWWFKGKVIHVCWWGHVFASAWSWILVLDCLLECQYLLPVSPTCKGKRHERCVALLSVHELQPGQQLLLPPQKQRWLPGSAACLPLPSSSSFLCPSVSPICSWKVEKISNLRIELGHLIWTRRNVTAGFVRTAFLGVSSQLIAGNLILPAWSTKTVVVTVPKCQAAPL